MAWEDIGLADPRAIQLANDAAATYERLGSPEGELALGQAVIYLAIAAKSNAGYNAFNAAMAFVKKDKSREVPVHLRNAPTKLMKELGYGHAYRYAHDEPNAYAAGETYLPDGMPSRAGTSRCRAGWRQDRREAGLAAQQLDDDAQVPMLFVFGARKPFMFHSDAWADKLAQKEGCKVVAFNTDHWPMLRQPERFNQLVMGWLEKPADNDEAAEENAAA
jgi:pimeloyl-ACP methyl ester carboxylesterase